jgi:2-hydroxychromene-2-carboxylate isomerase
MGKSQITVTHMADPGCPWAYSALPAITTLRWRYGDQLDWRIVTIGLSETTEQYERRGYTPARMAKTPLRFARFGMPYVLGPRDRVMATGAACRAIVAAREAGGEERAYEALRALSFGWFTTTEILDEPEGIARALSVAGVADAEGIATAIGHEDTEHAYQRDRAQARTAEGSPSALQERTAASDGPERYTAPSLFFQRDGQVLEAGGHQPLAAYDVLIANLAPELEVQPPPDGPLAVLERFPYALSTREVSTVLAGHDEAPDDDAATSALLDLVGEGAAERQAFGTGALWRLAG